MYDPNDEIMQRLAGRNRQGLFDRIKQNITNPSGDNAYKAGMLLFGQKPQDDSNEKLATQIALLNYKSQLPQKPNYLLGENGDVTQLPDGRIVQRPFGLTKTAQDRYEGRLEESKANRDAGLLKSGYVENDESSSSPQVGSKNYQFRPELVSQETSAQAAGKIGVENVQNLNDYMANANKVLMDLNQLEQQAESLGDFKPGPSQFISKPVMAYKEFTEDPTVANYMGTLTEKIGPIARTLQEEKGPLTEMDVQRAMTALGNKTTPLSVKKERINSMREKIRRAIEVKRQIAEQSLSNPYDVRSSSQIGGGNINSNYDAEKEARYQAWKAKQNATA